MSGIFTLGQVGRKQEGSTWDTVSDVFLTEKLVPVLGNYGYFAGGYDKNHIFKFFSIHLEFFLMLPCLN